MLTQRLSAAAELIGCCDTLYDVGCDHGYLALELLKSGRIRQACFCDISAPSLQKARMHARQENLEDRARFVLTDGLTGLSPNQDDAVSICGMGGNNVADILSRAGRLDCPVIVQANSERETMRRTLAALGYRAGTETMVRENRRFYFLSRYERGEETLDGLQELFGPRILEIRPPLFEEYLNWRKRVLEKALPGARADEADFRRIEEELKRIEEVLM